MEVEGQQQTQTKQPIVAGTKFFFESAAAAQIIKGQFCLVASMLAVRLFIIFPSIFFSRIIQSAVGWHPLAHHNRLCFFSMFGRFKNFEESVKKFPNKCPGAESLLSQQ